MGGLYVKTSGPLEVGAVSPFEFTLPDSDHSFRIKGKVIWNKSIEDKHGPPGMGVKFMETLEEDRKTVLQYLAQTQKTMKGY